MQSCSSPIPPQVSLKGGGMGQLRGRAQVPTAQSSFGVVCPHPGTTDLGANPSTKLQAGEKQPLLAALGRHR